MSRPTPGSGVTRGVTRPPEPGNASPAQPLGTLTDQVTRLVRDALRLSRPEVTGTATRLGAGPVGGVGLVAVTGRAAR